MTSGFTNTTVAGTADSSTLWAENRDLYALSDLLGYRYSTPAGRSYDIVDLNNTLDETAFPIESVLHGCAISRDWLDADMRIIFSKSRTDEVSGYVLCLDTLIGVLPLIDKDLHYRKRRHPGDVVAALLCAAPVEFCLIDAIVASHGADGRRAPTAIDTDTIIAATDIVLADYVGALKMGSIPISRHVRAQPLHPPLPERYIVAGCWLLSQLGERSCAVAARGGGMRNQAETLDRLVAVAAAPRPGTVSLKHPLDARLNAAWRSSLPVRCDPTGEGLLMLAQRPASRDRHGSRVISDIIRQGRAAAAPARSGSTSTPYPKTRSTHWSNELCGWNRSPDGARRSPASCAGRTSMSAVVFATRDTLPIDFRCSCGVSRSLALSSS